MRSCAALCVLLLCSAAVQGLQNQVEDEWDALDAPTKELYSSEANDLSAPQLASKSREKEAEEATPVRQAPSSHTETCSPLEETMLRDILLE